MSMTPRQSEVTATLLSADSNVVLPNPPCHPHTSADAAGESVAVVCSASLSSASTSQRLLGGRRSVDMLHGHHPGPHQTIRRDVACERLELAGCEPLSRSRECDALPARYTIEAEHLCCIQHTETPPCFTSLAYCLQRCLTRFLEALSLHFSHTVPVTSTMGLEAYPVTPVQRRPAGPRSMQGVVTRPVCGAMRA